MEKSYLLANKMHADTYEHMNMCVRFKLSASVRIVNQLSHTKTPDSCQFSYIFIE